jgi:hypothetical protein
VGSEPKDSEEVIQFRRLYSEVRAASENDPARLELRAQDDPSLSKLCSKLSKAVWDFERRRRPQLFAMCVDPVFVSEFREYEEHWQSAVAGVVLAPLLKLKTAPPKGDREKIQIEGADDDAKEAAEALDFVIRFAWDQVTQDDRDLGGEADELIEKINEGVAAWRQLTKNIVDLRGVFRRRSLAPFTHVPPHVAHPKSPSKSSQFWPVYECATDAFVMGNFHAAIALLRAIVESHLQRAYDARQFNLGDKIKSVRDVLPQAANAESLLRLRSVAVAVLHLESEKIKPEERQDAERRLKPDRIEEETRQLLRVVCALIEAPEQPNDCRS